ncbi:thiopurine S-methyltransferase [Permianibacter sp. IMCC34836]|uniref:thiopurine S-methyltransferase n=1 Tax=Permianibacter fluminis TaxID=2738515 RepID=UPI001557830F|nr:thiopurine S-methyltransferase [Permianibacter fluminis]NQD38759.1 thiopurine S-methyltransferase [Permianibacter fluminis]
MDIEFWQTRWQRGETGFHLPRPHPKLQSLWPTLCPDMAASVLVPLCGKSLDLVWLLARGHRVIGVEISELAVRAFFAEQGWQPEIERQGAFLCFRYQQLTIYCGDFFALTREQLLNCHHVYDRAALIALPPELRAAYSQHLLGLVPSAAVMLLLTLVYPQTEMTGPPFAVTPAELVSLYPQTQQQLLVDQDILSHEPRFSAKGVSSLHEQAWSIRW